MPETFYVYILASLSRRLYAGVTTDLQRRLREHRTGAIPGFTQRYRIHRLVYFETTLNARGAIAREQVIKGWTHEKRIQLIEEGNAGWLDLGAAWFGSKTGWTPPLPKGEGVGG
jgi:putative endonuclease